MEITRKTWGLKYNIFQNDLCETSILYLEPNRTCSFHTHQTKWNQFFVIEGELGIETEWKTDKETERGITTINKHEIFTTAPNEPHRFLTFNKPAIIQEIMYVKYDPNDIQRRTIGGCR